MKNKKGNVAVIALIIVIVAITASVITWLIATRTQAPTPQPAIKQQSDTPTPTTQTQSQQVQQSQKQESNSEENSIAQQLKIKFSLDIMRFWQVDEVFQHPKNPYVFYYISEDSTGQLIGRFDASKDKNYLQDGSPNIPAYNTFVYNEKLSSNNEFRGTGFDDDKFVFTETGKDNSPGPCSTPWLYGKLSYIDANTEDTQKKPYTLAGQKLQEINKQVADCQKEFEKEFQQ